MWRCEVDGLDTQNRNGLDFLIQIVAVNGLMSRWRAVMSIDPQGPVLELIVFDILAGNMESGIKCISASVWVRQN